MTVAQLDSLITLLRSRPAPATQDIADSRARFEKMAAFLGGAPDAKCEKVDVDGVPAEWVSAAEADASRAVLYLHGGGYAIGSLNTHRRLAYDLSATAAAHVLLIDYRLAPTPGGRCSTCMAAAMPSARSTPTGGSPTTSPRRRPRTCC